MQNSVWFFSLGKLSSHSSLSPGFASKWSALVRPSKTPIIMYVRSPESIPSFYSLFNNFHLLNFLLWCWENFLYETSNLLILFSVAFSVLGIEFF